MKITFFTKAFVAVAAFALSFAAMADKTTVYGVTYTYDIVAVFGDPSTPETARITKAEIGSVKAVQVPGTLGGKPVASIGSSAFKDCTALEEIDLPDTVTKIWDSAFMGCTALWRVGGGRNLAEINNYAFHGCSSLKYVPDFESFGALKSVGQQAFYGCSSLQVVYLSDGLNSLGDNAFWKCSALREAYLPAFFAWSDFRDRYFNECSSLKKVFSRDSVGGVAWSIMFVDGSVEVCPDFRGNPAIDENTAGPVEIPNTLCNRPVVSIGEEAFVFCSDITSVTIPVGVASIGKNSFDGCVDLKAVTIPGSVTKIGAGAFLGTSLETVYVDNGDADRVRGLLEASGCDVEDVAFLDGSEDAVVPVEATWYTTRAEAFAAARKTGKMVFMICGRDTCGNTMYTKNYSCEQPKVKAELVAKCELWYSNCDTQEDENYYYYPIGKFSLPLVCIIDPADDKHFIVRSTSYLEPEEVLAMLAGIPYPATDDYAGLDPFYPGEMPGYKVLNPADIRDPLQAPKAVTLLGALYYGNRIEGVIELKVGKMKNYQAKVSGTVTMLDGKKYTVKSQKCSFGDKLATSLNLEVKKLGGMRIAIGSVGGVNVFSGAVDKWHAQTANVGGSWANATATVSVAAGFVPQGVLEGLLPDDETAVASGGKWKFSKATSVKWTKPKNGVVPVIYDEASGKGLVVDTSKGTNLSGLKLTYTPKKGTFKGSFKMYALIGSGSATKLKKYTVSVTGLVVDGQGSGKATCKSPVLSWPVTVR